MAPQPSGEKNAIYSSSTIAAQPRIPRGKVSHFSEQPRRAEQDDQIPETQMERAQWLADELALCGWDEITAIEILDALACAGLNLMSDIEGLSSHEYVRGHKSAIRSAKADLN